MMTLLRMETVREGKCTRETIRVSGNGPEGSAKRKVQEDTRESSVGVSLGGGVTCSRVLSKKLKKEIVRKKR